MKPIKTSLRFRTICPSQRSKTTILVSSQSPQDASDTGVATFYQETTCLIEYQVPVLESKLKKAGHAKLNRTRFFFLAEQASRLMRHFSFWCMPHYHHLMISIYKEDTLVCYTCCLVFLLHQLPPDSLIHFTSSISVSCRDSKHASLVAFCWGHDHDHEQQSTGSTLPSVAGMYYQQKMHVTSKQTNVQAQHSVSSKASLLVCTVL